MVQEGRRIGRIVTSGVYKRNARDLNPRVRVATGNGAPPPPKPNKYRNQKVTIDGHTFDSKKEGEVYVQLCALEKAGAIRGLELQPKFEFPLRGKPLRHLPHRARTSKRLVQGRPVSYRADFSYEEQDGNAWKKVVLDVKGFDTQISRLKRAMVAAFHGVVVEIV